MPAHLTPQQAIGQNLPSPSECDIVIVILWSRLGTPLTDEARRSDGTAYLSGTEWEFEDAFRVAKVHGKPTILLYRRTEEPLIEARDPEIQDKIEQVKLVDAFFDRFRNKNGALLCSVHEYNSVDDFRELLRQNLEAAVNNILEQEVSADLGVTRAAVESMFSILKEQNVPIEQLESKLKEIARRHIELTNKLSSQSGMDNQPEIARRRSQAAQAIGEGNYDRAAAWLQEAFAIDQEAINEQTKLIRESKIDLDHHRSSAAATLSQKAELERTRLNYIKSADHFAEAAKLVPSEQKKQHLDYLSKQASALQAYGDEFGDNDILKRAIEIYERISSEYYDNSFLFEWSGNQNNLGLALQILGSREGGTDHLEKAVSAFENALNELTRQKNPIEWGCIQSNLGRTLQILGERESGPEKLELAIVAFNNALQELTQQSDPHQWARTQVALGNALQTLGRREEGSVRLEQSVQAYGVALRAWSSEASPLELAMTKERLGTALLNLGRREKETYRLEMAIEAFRDALRERTRERLPLEWARTQNCLGYTLAILGERNADLERLEESIGNCRNALMEQTPERAPIDWAKTQDSLGYALTALADLQNDPIKLQQGMDAYRSAIEVFEEKGAISYLEETSSNLENALTIMRNLYSEQE